MGQPADETARVFLHRAGPLGLFREVEEYVTALGPVRTRVSASQVSFGAKRQFAWVWLPTRWTGNRSPDAVAVSFGLTHRVEHPRIVEATRPRPGRWTHHVILERPADFGREVRQWLTEAYEQAR